MRDPLKQRIPHLNNSGDRFDKTENCLTIVLHIEAVAKAAITRNPGEG